MGDLFMIVMDNRRAYHDYSIEETYTAGIVLLGSEVKALRNGSGQWRDSWIEVNPNRTIWHHFYIPTYKHASLDAHSPLRDRYLLLKKKEMQKLKKQTMIKGYTLIPLKLVLIRSRFKLVFGLGKGKRDYDKRQTIKARDIARFEAREG
jgi:SsrA-binding protein